jgi:hypothetical protein
MYVTLEQLMNVDTKGMKPYIKKMLEDTISYVEENEGRAWVHPHVLADFGIKTEVPHVRVSEHS